MCLTVRQVCCEKCKRERFVAPACVLSSAKIEDTDVVVRIIVHFFV